MRHAKRINHLGRTAPHRKAMLSNMASSLILHKRITTTVAKAKALRTYVEPLITKSKAANDAVITTAVKKEKIKQKDGSVKIVERTIHINSSTFAHRVVFSYLNNKEAVHELFKSIAPKVADRPGGYTRILRTGFRKGDATEMCIIELVDYNENMLATTKETKKTTTRRSRRGGKKAGAVGSVETAASEIGTKKTPKNTEEKISKEEPDTAVVEDAIIVEETTDVEETTVIEEATVVVEEVKETEDVSEASEEEVTKE